MRFHVLMTADGSAEPCQLIGREVCGDGGVVFVGDVVLGETSEKFGPGEGGFFAIGEDAGFAPDGEQIELGGGDAHVARFVEMELGAEGAAVDLGGADFDELLQFGIEGGIGDGLAERDDGVVGCAGVGLEFLAGRCAGWELMCPALFCTSGAKAHCSLIRANSARLKSVP